jgi:ABC-type multidrug transport system ATPase subunit
MPATISVRDLRKSYGKVLAVAGVTFEVDRGEFFGILGPNGAGKTTTLEIIEGCANRTAARSPCSASGRGRGTRHCSP